MGRYGVDPSGCLDDGCAASVFRGCDVQSASEMARLFASMCPRTVTWNKYGTLENLSD